MKPDVLTLQAFHQTAAHPLPVPLAPRPSGLSRPGDVLESDQREHNQLICLTTRKGHKDVKGVATLRW